MSETEHPDEYFYDLVTGQVVQGKVRGATNRMGPYPTAEEAARAMQHAKERNEEWAAEERAWREER